MSDAFGWLKLWRSFREHPLWLKEPFTIGQAWVDLLMLANFKDSTVTVGHRLMTIRRGQVFTSLEKLPTRWTRDRKTVRAWLLTFGSLGILDREAAYGAAGGYTLLTIRNFDEYQGVLSDGLDRGTDRALDRGLPQSVEVLEAKEAQEGEKALARAFSINGQDRSARRHRDREWGGHERTR
jgi:hypothetical protein